MGFENPPKLAEKAETDEEKLVYYRSVRHEIRKYMLSLPDALSNE